MWTVARFYARAFAASSLPVAAVSAGALALWGSPGEGVRAALCSGVIFGIAMCVCCGWPHVICSRRRGQTDPSRASHATRLELGLAPPIAYEKCLAAVKRLRFSMRIDVADNPALIRARTALTMESFGERIEVRLSPKGDGRTEVSISSRPRVRLTIADFGVNFANVQKLRAGIAQ